MPTILHRLERWAKQSPEAPAQTFLVGQQWKSYSVLEMRDRIFHLALFLESKGISAGDAVAIYSYNTAEWTQMDLAPHLLGAVTAGIYPNSTRKDVRYILDNTEATVVAVQNADYYRKITGIDDEEPLPDRVKLLLVFDGNTNISPKAVAFDEAIRLGKKLAQGKKFEDYLERLDKNAPAFLIYTSGTTGHPKGAMLSHDNLCFAADVAIHHWKIFIGAGTMFSFLPLCHVAEKLHSIGAGITGRFNIYYSSKFENVSKELPMVEPTVLLSVPRLWEKMMEGAKLKIKEAPPIKRKLLDWAFSVAARVTEAKVSGKTPLLADLLQYQIADRLVMAQIRKAMGLGRAKQIASGAAALPAYVVRWFRQIGFELLEDYGQTESTGIICMSVPGTDCSGTVGKPCPGTEFKLAEDGEILSKGRHIFKGYYKNEKATQETVINGWLHSGDLAEVTEKGLIRIKGRKKEILKTSGGKMIAPVPIEEKLKENGTFIAQACMVGDGRKYLSALITIPGPLLEPILKKDGAVDGLVVRDPEINAAVKRQIDDLNATLASYERIKQFRILSREFTIESGELTPTLKMKRSFVENKYVDVIGEMYSSASVESSAANSV